MEVLYIPQLDGDDAGESPTAGRYRLLKRVPEGNAPKQSGGEVAEGDGEAARKGPRKVTDEQAAYLHAAVRCAEEALLRRVAEGEMHRRSSASEGTWPQAIAKRRASGCARAEGAQAAAAVYERTVDRLAPTNAPAAKAD